MQLRGILDRMGNPLTWSGPARVMLINGIFLPPALALLLRADYLFAHPEVEPYIDRGALEWLTTAGGLFAGFLVLSLVIGYLLSRAGLESGLFVHVANLAWWLVFGFVAYLVGPSTSPILLVFPLLSFFTLLLFRTRQALPGILTGIAVVLGTTVAERLGALPYAPYFATWPEVDGVLANEWVMATTAWSSFATGTALLAYALILRRWREQSAKLAEMTDVLKGMFGRYMSTEVMKTLLEEPGALELGGARRRVTMLLTDLRGFTSLAERLSPESVLSLLNDYFEVMVDVCLRHRGTINEITGDALLVTFGAANEMEDHAATAVACAIEMQNAMAQVNTRNAARQRPELQMGIAVHTADVVVGNIGSEKRSKFGVVGSAVNMTSRIESFSVGGQVLASQSIVDEVGALLRIDGRRQFTPKGFSEPLTIYEVGGIAGRHNVALELGDEALALLPKPLPVRWELVSEKRLGGLKGEGEVSRFSRTGVDLATTDGLDVLDDVRLNLRDGSAYLTGADVYAKVVWQGDGVARLRFTSIPPEILTYFEGIAT